MGLNERLRQPAWGLIRREGDRSREVDKPQRKNTFEPFANPNPEYNPNNLFVNNYGGSYAKNMELDRKGIEAVLRIAHLNGQVFLSSMPKSRDRSLEGVNKDGSVAAKKTLMFEDKEQELEDEKNPFYRTVPIAEGWGIEINDERMIEELQKKRLTGKKLQGKFVQEFNGVFTAGVFECIRREKLSSVKDRYFREKLMALYVFTIPPLQLVSIILMVVRDIDQLEPLIEVGSAWFFVNLVVNFYMAHRKKSLEYPDSFYLSRPIDHPWEYILPPVEIDKVARTLVLLSLPGKKLVKERK